MKTALAAFALLLSLAALGASGCGSSPDRKFVPSRSCIDKTGDEYARCNNREYEKLENTQRHEEAVRSMRGWQPVAPRKCTPNGYGGFDCK